jgi:hypothetical protein
MIDHHIHRVWVVAPSDYSGMLGYGIGCVSLTDVLTTIALFSSPLRSPELTSTAAEESTEERGPFLTEEK